MTLCRSAKAERGKLLLGLMVAAGVACAAEVASVVGVGTGSWRCSSIEVRV